MKTLPIKFIAIVFVAITFQTANAQVDWNTGGNNITNAEWFGADGASTIDLDIRHNAAQNINFRTFGTQRMTIKGNNTSNYGSWINNTGYVGIGMVDEPLSLLHLGHNCPSLNGWRPWMDDGMFICGGNDNAYFGLKQSEDFPLNGNRQDAVIAWGDDDDGTGGPDHLRILFIGGAPDSTDADFVSTPFFIQV